MTATRSVPLVALALLATALAIPSAQAQTLLPEGIGPYNEAYVVYGRVVDVNHRPALGVPYTVTFEDELGGTKRTGAVHGMSAERGDIQADFRIGEVTPHGTVTLTANGKSVTKALDPETRRTDLTLVLNEDLWPRGFRYDNMSWGGLYSVRVRAVDLTAGYPAVHGGSLFGKPVVNERVWVWLYHPNGTYDTPSGVGTVRTFEQGDFNYTFRLRENLTGGRVQVLVRDLSQNVTVDLTTRYSFIPFKFGESHLPDYPVAKNSPLPPWVALAGLGAAAGLLRLARRRPS
ncbi:MAG TPA: hypothetical protein VNZ52_02525 [Candidatus Thermoplasmatota archaeon]|nr:hypothetical protein [Candidatus Thermoplasmatota archaeon]